MIYVSGIRVRGQLHSIHNLIRGGQNPGSGVLFKVVREVVLVRDLIGTIVQANGSGVKVEICVHRHRISRVVRHAEFLRKEHECSGQEVVQLAMSGPVLAILIIAGAVARM